MHLRREPGRLCRPSWSVSWHLRAFSIDTGITGCVASGDHTAARRRRHRIRGIALPPWKGSTGSPRSKRDHDAEFGPLPLPAGPVSNGEFVPARTESSRPCDERPDPLVDRRGGPTAEHGPAALSPERRSRGRIPGRVRARRLWPAPPGVDRRRPPAAGRGGTFAVPSPDGHRSLSASADEQRRVHLRRAYASRHPERSLGPNAPETVGLILGMLPRRVHRQPAARLRGSCRRTYTISSWPATRPSRC